ncbi:M15 family metallopeptidase [Culturomica sp.]|uniref:M15 family metallopeptidase n=1 Tax=Culturomica sp. TaxID=1926652 RepID=UPI00257BDB11|nr:M15 family metallopeptidase [Culturomica sp.]
MTNKRSILIFVFVLFLLACTGRNKTVEIAVEPGRMVEVDDSLILDERIFCSETETEKRMLSMGLVDIGKLDRRIKVKLVYATPDNFTGKVLYRELRKAYMRPLVAEKLIRAQDLLENIRTGWQIVVYDAARPMSVQREMWELVKGTPRHIFVSNPGRGGGLHNYGLAVDVTLCDSSGGFPDMGSAFDYFGEEARGDKEEELVIRGKITPEAFENRQLLRKVMTEAGFIALGSEWWHFNALPRREVIGKWERIE